MSFKLPSEQNIWAVVVTFHPTAQTVENLCALTAQVSAIVVDNTPGPTATPVIQEIQKMDRVEVLRLGENQGIATALNRGIQASIQRGASWVATFDQDSTVTPGFFAGLNGVIANAPHRDSIGLIAPQMFYPETNEYELGPKLADLPEITVVRTALTSGSLIRTKAFTRVGFYDETLFIDYVDYEHGFRLQRAGYCLVRANRVLLHHHLGTSQTRRWLGREITVKAHSPWRRYYITRNRLITYRRHGGRFPGWMLRDAAWFFLELGKIILVEDQKVAKLRAIGRGFWDGVRGRTGSRN